MAVSLMQPVRTVTNGKKIQLPLSLTETLAAWITTPALHAISSIVKTNYGCIILLEAEKQMDQTASLWQSVNYQTRTFSSLLNHKENHYVQTYDTTDSWNFTSH